MQRVTDQVDPDYLEQAPPRPLPPVVMLNLLGDYTFEKPLSTILNPLLLSAMIIVVVLVVLRANVWIVMVPLLVVGSRFGLGAWRVWHRTRDDLRLLREGLTIRAHILRLRPHRNVGGQIDGALLDCAIAVAPRRTYVGSIWISDGLEANRLLRQGRMQVICLPRTPGTWRVIDEIKADVRYDRVGPVQAIPHDI